MNIKCDLCNKNLAIGYKFYKSKLYSCEKCLNKYVGKNVVLFDKCVDKIDNEDQKRLLEILKPMTVSERLTFTSAIEIANECWKPRHTEQYGWIGHNNLIEIYKTLQEIFDKLNSL